MPTAVNNIIEKNLSFYNAIAGDYDALLEEHDHNKMIRITVADIFCKHVKSGPVLDFGGGTGLDTEWLSKKYTDIFFCEPSSSMREKAMLANKENGNIVFLNGRETDFTQWNLSFPFNIKMNGILLNFAVINCIAEIDLLFERFAEILNPGGNIIALVLNSDVNLLTAFKNMIFNKTGSRKVKYKEFEHTVFLYSINDLKKASNTYFEFQPHISLARYGFNLIHLKKK